jgi:hypothetical protein
MNQGRWNHQINGGGWCPFGLNKMMVAKLDKRRELYGKGILHSIAQNRK